MTKKIKGKVIGCESRPDECVYRYTVEVPLISNNTSLKGGCNVNMEIDDEIDFSNVLVEDELGDIAIAGLKHVLKSHSRSISVDLLNGDVSEPKNFEYIETKVRNVCYGEVVFMGNVDTAEEHSEREEYYAICMGRNKHSEGIFIYLSKKHGVESVSTEKLNPDMKVLRFARGGY